MPRTTSRNSISQNFVTLENKEMDHHSRYRSGIQNGIISVTMCIPRIGGGVVDTSVAASTTINFG